MYLNKHLTYFKMRGNAFLDEYLMNTAEDFQQNCTADFLNVNMCFTVTLQYISLEIIFFVDTIFYYMYEDMKIIRSSS